MKKIIFMLLAVGVFSLSVSAQVKDFKTNRTLKNAERRVGDTPLFSCFFVQSAFSGNDEIKFFVAKAN